MVDNDNTSDRIDNPISKSDKIELVRLVFKFLWSRHDDFYRILRAYAPRRLEQEKFFRQRGKNCKYYTALCKTIVLDALEGKTPEIMRFLNEEVQHAGSTV